MKGQDIGLERGLTGLGGPSDGKELSGHYRLTLQGPQSQITVGEACQAQRAEALHDRLPGLVWRPWQQLHGRGPLERGRISAGGPVCHSAASKLRGPGRMRT